MSKYCINDIRPLEAISNGLYLVVLHADTIPPHLGVINNKKYYSLTIKGQTIGEDVVVLKKLIRQKKIKTLFFELNTEAQEDSVIEKRFREETLVSGNVTCLFPIRKLLSEMVNPKIISAKFVFEVLPILYESKKVKSVFQLNLTEQIENESYFLEKYSMQDIIDRIRKYENAVIC